jgi:hypothetical protein
MAEITKVNGQTLVDYMARDYDSLLQSMWALIPEKLPEWTDYSSEADFGNVLLQLFAHMGDILSYYQDRIANESFLGTAQTRRSIIQHLRLIGYRLSTAAPAAASLTLTVPKTVNDTIIISKGDAFATKSQKDKKSVRFEYTSETPLKIEPSEFTDDPTDINRKLYITNDPKKAVVTINLNGKIIYAAGIPVEEGQLIKDEIIGISDGSRNQQFKLAHAGLILRSLGPAQAVNRDIILTTTLGTVIDEWTLQESLAFSREERKDFAVEIDEQDRATVLFGDGAFGSIPPQGATIKATYRVGGGTQGNVLANTITTIMDAPQLSNLGAQVTNPMPATGGAERESIDHAVQYAPAIFRSLRRAVTAEDYQALALDFKGVGKVRAEAPSWNTVTLYVAPEGGGYVSDVLRHNLLAYFEDKRPVSTVIEIENVDYAKIYVTALVGIKPYYAHESVKEQVQVAAGNLLTFENVDFGKPLYLSKFYEAIEALEGVDHVMITQFQRAKKLPVPTEVKVEPTGKIELGVNEIARIPNDPEDGSDYSGGIKVTFEGEA